MTGHAVCLLLGSNIRPEFNLKQPIVLLNQRLPLKHVSSVWETSAVGSEGPNFLNAAAMAQTSLDVQSLKEQILHPIEAQLGRVRSADKYAPRTIDVDPIFFDGEPLDDNLEKYAFAAVPAAELLPRIRVKSGATLRDVALRLLLSQPIHLRPDVLLHAALE
jgi:2-amino-4-hydroxy-6-hydroxymethyldihydropteridine diphosphokinase